MSDSNYTDPNQSSSGAIAERVGDMTGEPPSNIADNMDKASKMANLLEGLEFPASKEEIRRHVNMKSPEAGNRINDVLEAIENNLDDRKRYDNTYEVEVAAGLVKPADGKSIPGRGQERIKPANAREVSPNTPPGEGL
jgi:hypothetical protein